RRAAAAPDAGLATGSTEHERAGQGAARFPLPRQFPATIGAMFAADQTSVVAEDSEPGSALSQYREIARADWARLAAGTPQPLSETEVVQLRGLGDRLDIDEVREVY